MAELPSGTVTFLFTDIEGSTARWEQQPAAMRVALARHDGLIRAAIEEHGGHVVKTMGDAFHAAFARAPDAVAAAIDAQRGLQAEDWGGVGPLRVRMALHTGVAEERDGDYYGPPLNRAARLLSAGHGGQVLLSEVTAALGRESLPPDARLLDLGRHRLKDLVEAEHVFQVVLPDLQAEFPTLVSLDARPHNLPTHPTALLGREREVAEVGARFREGARLVTLTGPGGTGKTRLSLQVAADLLDDFEDGVFLVELAPITDPAVVPSAIAQVLGVRDVGSRPVADTLKDFLTSRTLLVVLDNFEQIVAAAPVVADLLAASPGLASLVTSREALRVRGEREYPVPPLDVPDLHQPLPLDALSRNAAVALFVERAVAVRSDFALTTANAGAIAEICARLDGLPLAIELAAARIRLLSPDAMLARLERRLPLLTGGARDLPARQRTLRDTIVWSYDLLDDSERRLFRRLSVFVGGWTLSDAEAICDPEGDLGSTVLEGLESLASKSLVIVQDDAGGEPRFGMLSTIREYAQEHLEHAGETSILRRQHAEHFVVRAEQVEPRLSSTEGEIWLDRLQAIHDDLRAVLEWSQTEDGDAELGLRLAGALSRFWQIRSHLSEGLRWFEAVLSSSADSPAWLRAKALIGAGWLADGQGDRRRAAALFEQAIEPARESGDRVAIANAIGNLGTLMDALGNYERAEALLEESLRLNREAGHIPGVAARLHNLGNVACSQGHFERARALLEESIALRRRVGGTYSKALAVGGLGLVALYQGDHERARPLFEETLIDFRSLAHTYGIAWSLHYLGRVALLRGEIDPAVGLLLESLTMREALEDKGGIAQCLEGLAAVALARRQADRAARLYGAAISLRDAIDSRLSPAERIAYERELAAARDQIGEDALAAAWAEGEAMAPEQAVADALEEAGPSAAAGARIEGAP